ncbi:ricin-type beta-trefoil lectin domain protein [Streptomyces sp. CRN 30]|uniref:ricin-type beta-trefoil lectin domain protein n=1 Tax=Streptomyces sp. CRN 30 TaxID=3075613 RepID=UPI002A807EC4|nr:ricin-type beta-trefoil lectin domain protein [Streptomyces sp. CRN 30]
MAPPPTPPSAGDLPKRVPGSGRRAGPAPTPVRPGPAAAPSADRGDSLPRLTQFSSLGTRAASDGPREEPAAPRPVPEPASRPAAKGRLGDVLKRRPGDRARREGSRGALGVVGVVGLLSAGAVVLVLTLSGRDDGGQRDGASVSVGTDDYRVEDVAEPDGGASASASAPHGGKPSKDPASPSADASPSAGGSASAKAAKDAEKVAGAPAGGASDSAEATTAAPSEVSVRGHASQRCLAVVGGQPVAGTRLMIWDCHDDSASQRWTFASDGTMRVLGMCVQLGHGSTADGAELRLAECDGGDTQQFELNHRHDIVSRLADKCADVQDGATANGARVQLWSCNGLDQQKWSRS